MDVIGKDAHTEYVINKTYFAILSPNIKVFLRHVIDAIHNDTPQHIVSYCPKEKKRNLKQLSQYSQANINHANTTLNQSNFMNKGPSYLKLIIY
jgi:hypothetical protein